VTLIVSKDLKQVIEAKGLPGARFAEL